MSARVHTENGLDSSLSQSLVKAPLCSLRHSRNGPCCRALGLTSLKVSLKSRVESPMTPIPIDGCWASNVASLPVSRASVLKSTTEWKWGYDVWTNREEPY